MLRARLLLFLSGAEQMPALELAPRDADGDEPAAAAAAAAAAEPPLSTRPTAADDEAAAAWDLDLHQI